MARGVTMLTAAQLVERLLAYRIPIGQELAMQQAVAEILDREGCLFEREFDLGPGRGRIDFYLPTIRVGLELKVKGSPADVLRQLQRYTTSDQIDALILVSGRARFGAFPSTLGGKALHVAAIWRGLL